MTNLNFIEHQLMLFLTICECLGMQLQLSEHFTYPNTLRSQRVRITEVLLYVGIPVCRFVYDSMGNPYKKNVYQNAWEDLRILTV